MKLSSANRSEIQPDLSNKAFKYLASYTQIEKLTRDIDKLKLIIFNAIKEEDKIDQIEKYVELYKKQLKKLNGYGLSTYIYDQYLGEMMIQLEKMKK